MDINDLRPLVNAVKDYIEAKGITFNQVDACRFLQKTVNISLWGTTPEVYSKNASSVVELVDTGRTEVSNYIYWLYLNPNTERRFASIASYTIEEVDHSGRTSKFINEDILLNQIDTWFLTYLDRKFSYRSKPISGLSIKNVKKDY